MHNKKDCIAMIQDLTGAFGPSGFEDEVLRVIRHYTHTLGEITEDTLRNFYLSRKENRGQKPIFMLDAHSDEVGFMTKAINPDGTLQFLLLGGWDKHTLPGTRVLVRNQSGEYIPGIVVSKPRQFMSTDERNQFQLHVSQLAIDVGSSSREETIHTYSIQIGDPIAPESFFYYDLQKNLMFGKAFDCRIGCAALIETLRRLQGVELPFDIVGVFSAQEEVGDRGCRVAVNRVHPQIAYCYEGCPADDTFAGSTLPQTAIKKGPMFRFMDRSVICTPRYQRYVLDLAEKKNIPIQCSVREHGGCNAAIINTSDRGIPTVVAGIPVRYIHTGSCITCYDDFEATVQLSVEVIRSLTLEDLHCF